MIDNLERIKPLLNFETEGDFYMLYVLKRKKDQPEGERDNHQSVRTIKTYCVDSIDYLEKRYPEIMQLCEIFSARAYIHIQKQNHKDVSLNMMVALAEKIKNGQPNQKNLFDSVVGQLKTNEKRWIVDIDTKSIHVKNMMANIIESVRPTDKGSKIEAIIPTKNGIHLITKRFDVMEFGKQLAQRGEALPDIQKKNPTLLYLPESLS
jgi:hypothetical protein